MTVTAVLVAAITLTAVAAQDGAASPAADVRVLVGNADAAGLALPR